MVSAFVLRNITNELKQPPAQCLGGSWGFCILKVQTALRTLSGGSASPNCLPGISRGAVSLPKHTGSVVRRAVATGCGPDCGVTAQAGVAQQCNRPGRGPYTLQPPQQGAALRCNHLSKGRSPLQPPGQGPHSVATAKASRSLRL